jgi:ribonuclease HII
MTYPDFTHERALTGLVAGVDEAGRGPLAGPVSAAAVILDPHHIPPGLNDSKKLTAATRATLFDALHQTAQIGLVWASVAEIDCMNIRNASLLAMRRAVMALPNRPDHALIDGNALPADLPCKATALIKGDAQSLSIAAASIIAKVARDRVMQDLARDFPGYGWETNQGYPTAMHRQALQDLGPTPHHRVSFAPVRNML